QHLPPFGFGSCPRRHWRPPGADAGQAARSPYHQAGGRGSGLRRRSGGDFRGHRANSRQPVQRVDQGRAAREPGRDGGQQTRRGRRTGQDAGPGPRGAAPRPRSGRNLPGTDDARARQCPGQGGGGQAPGFGHSHRRPGEGVLRRSPQRVRADQGEAHSVGDNEVQGSPNARTQADALAKVNQLEGKLKAGGDFAALAKSDSDDPGSKDKGGELGEVAPGQTVPEFDTAIKTLAIGHVSDPVHTRFGYHIIVVESRDTVPFEQAKASIADQLTTQAVGSEIDKIAANAHINVSESYFGPAKPSTPPAHQ